MTSRVERISKTPNSSSAENPNKDPEKKVDEITIVTPIESAPIIAPAETISAEKIKETEEISRPHMSEEDRRKSRFLSSET